MSATGQQEIRVNMSSDYRCMAMLLDPKGRGNFIAGIRAALEFARVTGLSPVAADADAQHQQHHHQQRTAGLSPAIEQLLLSDADVELTKHLGAGNYAAGIRRALVFAAAHYINNMIAAEVSDESRHEGPHESPDGGMND